MPTALRLVREPSTADGATFGALYLNGRFQCWTLEDRIREQVGVPVADWKIPHVTAIPAGTYLVCLTPSKRFGRVLPEVLAVPGYTGVRIHAGNTVADTDGCILVGRTRDVATNTIGGSRVALEALLERVRTSPSPVLLTIDNPPPAPTGTLLA